MFKSWSKKNRVKAVFKLQFQATQVPKLKKSALMISFVPEDAGKPTVKLEKAEVEDGTCVWENPVYETVKLIREQKTGKMHEKIYHFIVSTGSTSKSGFLGEASLDFADFTTEMEPMTVSLPLKFANSGAILHVTIQRTDGDKPNQRDEEENVASTLYRERSFENQPGYNHEDGNNNSAENEYLNGSTNETPKQNGSLANNTQHVPGIDNDAHNRTTFFSTLRQNSMPTTEKRDNIMTKNHTHRRSNTNWSLGSASDGSFGDSTHSFEDNHSRDRLKEADDTIEKVKNENALLIRQLEVSQMELHSLRKQVAKEVTEGQNLSRQVISLTEEKDALKTEWKQLKHWKKYNDEAEDRKLLQSEIKDTRAQLDAVRQELEHEKKLRTNFELQVHKTRESNSELILAVTDLEEMIELKDRVIADLKSNLETWKNEEKSQDRYNCQFDKTESKQYSGELDTDQHDIEELELLKQKITELVGEINIQEIQRDELKMQIEQLILNNESLKQENQDIYTKLDEHMEHYAIKQNEYSISLVLVKELEEQVEMLEVKIERQANALSESLTTVNELQFQVKDLETELEKQAQGFDDNINAMRSAKIKQEQRAIKAEEALRKTRWKNAITAERLQEEFKKISAEMASKYDDNERITMKAVTEANELRQQNSILEDLLQNANEECGLIKDQTAGKLQELCNQLDIKTKQTEEMLIELSNKSKQLENIQNHDNTGQQEIQRLHSMIEKLTAEKPERELFDSAAERDNLETLGGLANKESNIANENLVKMKFSNDQKDMTIADLLSEIEDIKTQYTELKMATCKEDREKENLRKQVYHLKEELLKKEEMITRAEKNLKHKTLETGASDVNLTSLNNESEAFLHISTEVATLQKTVQLLQEKIQIKEAALENSTTSFLAEKEKLHSTIKELERKLERFTFETSEKESKCGRSVVASIKNFNQDEQESLLHSKTRNNNDMPAHKEDGAPFTERKWETYSDKEIQQPISIGSNENIFGDLYSEISMLKEKNISMEKELKEMEERYSEVSLKFAEVEGERQQLVMTVRNLQNGKKN